MFLLEASEMNPFPCLFQLVFLGFLSLLVPLQTLVSVVTSLITYSGLLLLSYIHKRPT